MEVPSKILWEIIGFIRGRLEDNQDETVGVRKAKQEARYRVKLWANETWKDLKNTKGN